jgi:acyl-CoA synthetase (NDP forming)
MDQAQPRVSLNDILHPRVVAVFGASENKDKFGGRIMHFLVRHGFAGEIMPINPNRKEILGRVAYPRIADVPARVEVAILAVPTERLLDSIDQCAAAGVGCCVIVTTGFAEASAEGARLQEEIVDRAIRAGMRIIGPNCMGLINPAWKMALCSSVVLDTDRLLSGKIGLISQSGALMVSLFDRAASDGIGLSACVSLGNQADIEICDVLEYMIDDPGTKAICLYVEGFRDPPRFVRAAAACRQARKPLVVVKTGRTPAGVRAAQSHTASLAGSFEAFAAICREHGVILADDPVTMIRIADLLVRWPAGATKGIGVVSSSGGGAGIMVDRFTQAGMRLARLSGETRAELGKMLLAPQADNPIDLGGRLLPESVEIADKATAALAADADVSLVAVYLSSMPFFTQRTRLLAETAMASGKPVVVAVLPGKAGDKPRAALRELDCPQFDSVEDLLATLRGFLDYHASLGEEPSQASRPGALPDRLPDTCGSLAELAARYRVPFARERSCADVDTVVEAARAIGYPVVMKGIVTQGAHKSDLGLVKTDLRDEAAMREASAAIDQAVKKHGLRAEFSGYQVQEQVASGLELIVSIRRDAQFGPLVLVGAGGVMVELMRDTQSAPAPVSPARAEELLRGLRLAPLFDGFRGGRRLDIAAAAQVVCELSWLASDLGERLIDMEINPLIVGEIGQGVRAVDLRGSVDLRLGEHPAQPRPN